MEVSLRGGSLTKISNSDSIFTIYSVFITGTRSLGYLSTQWRGYGNYIYVFRTIMNWHLFSFAKIKLVASELVSHLLDAKSSPQERASFSVLGENKIMI